MEFFGVKLDGFHFTEHGWVQSYGSRYVRPPIIYGDVEFTGAMTVKEFKFAQSLTKKPVKGMLTGQELHFSNLGVHFILQPSSELAPCNQNLTKKPVKGMLTSQGVHSV